MNSSGQVSQLSAAFRQHHSYSLLILLLYLRQMKNTPTHGSAGGGNELSTPDFNAR